MIHNSISQGHWMNQSNNGYNTGNNYNMNRNNNAFQNNGGNGNQNMLANKRPRGGYRGGNYSDNFQGKSDATQHGRKGNPNK
ncbi:hypothetical protein PGT21_011833 [Puccinia graminis f. sp. tritici]|uniref:Uncharacterized protein n=1 Tax=Puccinia graminis f. sp. tritici TaxID=56615 RepID=A0A5B0M5G1_PUCGR|nr:hypothetical protein PGTUg99_026392 [Puccinia graminis f. sp. tritici]KAA1071566.1 hypothetical protein PGT21_011833 [Puccinia graminis f. sp. tritici]